MNRETSLEGAPAAWYRTGGADDYDALFFEQGGEEAVGLALAMLRPAGGERVLDLACGAGRRTHELSRRGYEAFGVEVRAELLEIAGVEAQEKELWPCWFQEADPRCLEFSEEFEIALSLGAGAFGRYDSDAEDLRAFEAVARALRPGGRLLMQAPNLPYVEDRLPARTWVDGGRAVDLIEQRWDATTGRIVGRRKSLLAEEDLEHPTTTSFQLRVYSVEELAGIFEQVGLSLADVYDEHGAPCAPGAEQREIYVEARRG
jgi:SAM-dependent methyltransferase